MGVRRAQDTRPASSGCSRARNKIRMKDDISVVDKYFSQMGSDSIPVGSVARRRTSVHSPERYQGKIQGYESERRHHLSASYRPKPDRFSLGYRVRYQTKGDVGSDGYTGNRSSFPFPRPGQATTSGTGSSTRLFRRAVPTAERATSLRFRQDPLHSGNRLECLEQRGNGGFLSSRKRVGRGRPRDHPHPRADLPAHPGPGLIVSRKRSKAAMLDHIAALLSEITGDAI